MNYVVQSPLSVNVTKNKKFILNLNNYRNAHYFMLNQAKKEYKETVLPQLENLPRFSKINITYTVYPQSLRKFDLANVCSIVDKFFCDALVESGHLEDDNYTYIPNVTYLMGTIDKNNPRVEIRIEEICST